MDETCCGAYAVNSMRRTAPIHGTSLPTVKVGAHREVQLPNVVTKRLRIREGAKLEVLVSGDGIFLIPSKRIPKERRYFYTEEWQAKEREADESIARGEVTGPFSNAVAAIRALRTAKV